jgi:hypothetical protein
MAVHICNNPIDNHPTIISPALDAWTDAPIVLLETTQLRAYIHLTPHKAYRNYRRGRARSFIADMRAFFAVERTAWKASQPEIGIDRLMFIDKTGASTKMARR